MLTKWLRVNAMADHCTPTPVTNLMTDTDHEVALHGRSYAELQQWIHDLRTPLTVIAMGFEALQQVRYDDQQFNELSEMISREGIGPLKNLLEALGNEKVSRVT